MPSKSRLGQNLLHDSVAIRRIVTALGDCSNRTVVEIGPGLGAITRELAQKTSNLIAVEVDPQFASRLRAMFPEKVRQDLGETRVGNVRVENVDVLSFDFRAASAGQKLLVAGNLPYYITSPILMKLAAESALLDRAVLMVQREVADRVTAGPGSRDYGLLSVTVQMHGPVEPLFTLPPNAFSPPPEVHSTVFRWRFEPRFEALGVDRASFLSFLRQVFALKRKTLTNNLRAAGYAADSIAGALRASGIDALQRAESLPPEVLAALWRNIQPPPGGTRSDKRLPG